MHSSGYTRYGKYLLDQIMALCLLLFLGLPGSFILLIQWMKCGRNAFFLQERVGKEEVTFWLIKLRTLEEIEGEFRATGWGKWLRRWSIDEWPQLWNVLRGDMSLVGPRPLLVEYLPHYSERHRRRHEVLPGMTGLAQVNGRNALTWAKRFDWDVHYVDHLSFWLDLKILWQTFNVVRQSRKADFHDQPLSPFTGYDHS